MEISTFFIYSNSFIKGIYLGIFIYNLMGEFMKTLILILTFLSLNVRKNSFDISDCKSAILVETESGQIIYENNKDERLRIASMTKIMTMTLILEEINKGKLSFDDVLTTSKNAASQTGSRIFLSLNEKMSVYDLLKGIAVASANDASVLLAEHIGGNVSGFVDMMNEYANNLGLKNTHFSDPTGLSDENHYSSSHDMAIMACNLINKFPNILDFTKIYQDYLRKDSNNPFWLVNTNKLVRFEEGVDGLKTGWTEKSGYCLTATKKVNNMRLVGVIIGSSSAKQRNADMVSMLNYGFSNYSNELILENNKIIKKMYDFKYYPPQYNLVIDKDIYLLKGKNMDMSKLKYKENIKDEYIDVYYDDALIKRCDLMSDRKLKKASFFEKFKGLIDEIIRL